MSRETQVSSSSESSRGNSSRLLPQIALILAAVLLTLFYVGLLFSGVGLNLLSSVLIHGPSASEQFDLYLLLFIPPYAISMVLWWCQSRHYRARIKLLSRVTMLLSFLVLLYLVSVSASFDLLLTMI